MKLVRSGVSRTGTEIPAALPARRQCNKYVMLSASVRSVCKPSSSFNTSSGDEPCTWFQYCDETTGILEI